MYIVKRLHSFIEVTLLYRVLSGLIWRGVSEEVQKGLGGVVVLRWCIWSTNII